MAKDKSDGFLKLKVIPGGPFDHFQQARSKQRMKLPKNPDKAVDMLVDTYGVDAIADMTEIDIGDYVYEKGINHSLNMNVGRNIPWIEDGLKSVERRILYIMYKDHLYNGKFDKIAGISGDMIKNVHPHGDLSINDTIYRMGRKRSVMIPYIKGNGNFGNMDTQKPAAPRYASGSLSDYAVDCFFSEMGAKYPIYDVKDNYKYSDKEPVFLTSKYPNILLQWNQGIGKGAAAWLGAFNSADLFKVTLRMLDDPDCKVDIYPDTPLPVDIINKKELKGCFDKAAFKVKMRAKYKIVADKRRDEHGKIVDKFTVVFTSLPLGVIGQVVKGEIQEIKEADQKRSQKRLPEVLEVQIAANDKTPGGIEFVVEYEKGYDPEALVEKLFKSTSLAKTVGVRYVLITDNKPEFYTPRQILMTWITQRYDQKRRYYHQLALKAAKDRSRLEAVCLILENSKNTDTAISIIRGSKDNKTAIKSLMKTFDFTEYQATCIMQLKLQNLPKMDIDAIREERDQCLEDYKYYRKLLSDDTAIKDAIREELEYGLKKYGKDRMADLVNLNTDAAVGDPTVTKTVVYDDTTFWAYNDDQDIVKIGEHGTRGCKITSFRNDDTVLLIGKNGQVKILNGFAFTNSDGGIGSVQLGIPSMAGIIPVTKNLSGVAMISSAGYGKYMEIDEITKSTKSKITVLNQGDTLVGVIPIYGKNQLNDLVAVAADDKLYLAELKDFPTLKRNAAGNRIIKVNPGTLTDAYHVPADSTNLLIYGEYGYVKMIDMSVVKINKRNPKPVDMAGKTIQGIVSIKDEVTKVRYYDNTGITEFSIKLGKTIHLTAQSGEEYKFRIGTTIGSPVKVFKKGKDEFYQIIKFERG